MAGSSGEGDVAAVACGSAELREQFELPAGTYLFSHAVGPLMRAGRQAALRHLDVWAAEGCDAWDAWLTEIEGFRGELAALLGGELEQWVPQANVSAGLVKLIGSLPRRPGRDRIVISELDFPTVGHVAAAAQKLGYRLEIVSAEGSVAVPGRDAGPAGGSAGTEARTPEEAGKSAGPTAAATEGRPTDPRLLALGDDVQLLVWTHAYPDVGRLAEPPTRAQLNGAYLAVDVCQSAGVAPIDVARWDADFVVGSCVKWICGGTGAGFLWVRRELLAELEPVDVGWFSQPNPFSFDIRRFDYAPDARRFWGGTPSVMPYAIAAASLRVIRGIGVDAIRAWNQRLTGRLIDAARGRGQRIVSPDDPQLRSGTMVIGFADDYAAVERLRTAGVRADKRRFGVRLSPHCFTSEDEIERVCDLL